MSDAATKKCVDCSASQQIKCFGAKVVSQGLSKTKKCNKKIKNCNDLPE
jgi:hypothetical protein